MGTLNNECPAEILIDIKEDEKYLFSNPNSKGTKSFFKTTLTELQKSNSGGSAAPSKRPGTWETILDISPSRICEEFNGNRESEVNLKQSLKSEISEGCPTAVLIELSPPAACIKDSSHVSSSTQHFNENELTNCTVLNMENQGEKLCRSSNYANSHKTEDYHSSLNSSDVPSQMPLKRLRWKTPSPQSMSRISKEASKIIDHLNSSVFDEELLLTEEILPVTLNFDEFDDDTDHRSSADNGFEDAVLNNEESSFGQKSLCKIEKVDEKLSSQLSEIASEKIETNLKQSFLETNTMDKCFEVSSKNDSKSRERDASRIHSSSLDNSCSLASCNEADVFSVTCIASEDTENMQKIKNKVIFTKENKIVNKNASKNLWVSKSKFDQRCTLRNLSNIKQDTSARRLSLSVNNNVTTPLKRMSISGNRKMIMPRVEKPQVKKTAYSVESEAFQFQNTKDLISSAQKSRPSKQICSARSSLSSEVKQQKVFATPSKRYSICTPLKSSSAIKPSLTPALTSSHNFMFPNYTPQPVRPFRLSFSRSWQPSGDNSHFFPTKGIFSTALPSNTSKIASGIKNSSKLGKLSFSQSMSSVPEKNMSKKRFSSKLLSPLSVEQDKKVARALFTSVSEK